MAQKLNLTFLKLKIVNFFLESRKGYQIFHLIVHKRKYTLNRSINGMHGYDKYCQKRYSIIENYDAIARFVYSEYMQDSASSA